MRRAPAATPRTRPDARPRKLTRRSASPSGNVFRMMASVSRAGMSCRRADAASNELRHTARNARARRTIVDTIRALAAQSLRGEFSEILWKDSARKFEIAGMRCEHWCGKDLRKAQRFECFPSRKYSV